MLYYVNTKEIVLKTNINRHKKQTNKKKIKTENYYIQIFLNISE